MPINTATGAYALPENWFQDIAGAINGVTTQIQSGSPSWGGTAGGTAAALTITVAPASFTDYVAGQTFRFLIGAAANTGAATLAVNNLSAKTILRHDGSGLVAGDLPASSLVVVVYDGNAFRLLSWQSADLTALDGLTGTGLIEHAADGSMAIRPIGSGSAAAIPTKSDVDGLIGNAVNGLVNGAPGALDTLNELAAALGNDSNFATSVTNALAGKAASGHDHTVSAITDFDEAVEDRVASLLRAGSNVTLAYDDGAGALTISASGGSGGGSGLFTGVTTKSANDTAVAADAGKLIDCTAGLTLSLASAAVLGAGWTIGVVNNSNGTVVLAPAGSDRINGDNTGTILPHHGCIITCSGTGFFVIGGDYLLQIPASNLEFYLIANRSDSYSPSIDPQKWRNAHALPSSGSYHAGYDFYRGLDGTSSTTDPLFNGTVGGKSSSEYFSSDGGDCFQLSLPLGSSPDYFANMHKDNATFSLMFLVNFSSLSGFPEGILLSTGEENNAYANAHFRYTSSGANFNVKNGAGTAINKTSTAVGVSTGLHCIGLSVNEAGSGFFYQDNAYLNDDSGNPTWSAAYASPATSGITGNSAIRLFAAGWTGGLLYTPPAGSRIYAVAAYSSALSLIQMQAVEAAMRADCGNL